MASNFSLSTLLNTATTSATGTEKSSSFQLDKADGDEFYQAFSDAQNSQDSFFSPPPAAKQVATPPPSSGKSSPVSPPPEKRAETNAAQSAPPKQQANDEAKPVSEKKPDDETVGEASQESKSVDEGKSAEECSNKDKVKDEESTDQEEQPEGSENLGRVELSLQVVGGENATAEEKDSKESDPDKNLNAENLTPVVLTTAAAVSPSAGKIEGGKDVEKEARANPESLMLSTASDLAVVADKVSAEKLEKSDKTASTGTKTMSSLEFKLQVQASQLEAKADSAGSDLAGGGESKKEASPRFSELSNLSNALGTSARTQASPLLSTSIKTPMGHPGWGAEVAEKVLWMASQKVQSADISINPPDLGPIEAKIQMQQDQVSVTFSAQHAPVKEALEQSLPKLREMMAQNGVNLGSVDIHDNSQSQQQQQWARQESNPGYGVNGSQDEVEDEMVETAKQIVMGRGMVDFYA